jgi:gluconate kinase
VIVGAPGSGKSAVLGALAALLETAGVEYGSIESEQLAQGSPLLPASEWTSQLEVVLALQREAGRRLFVVVATPEDAGQLRTVVDATRASTSLVVCLSAPPATLAARLAAREPDRWPGKQPLIAHARALADVIPRLEGIDIVLDSVGADDEAIAALIYEAMESGGLLA